MLLLHTMFSQAFFKLFFSLREKNDFILWKNDFNSLIPRASVRIIKDTHLKIAVYAEECHVTPKKESRQSDQVSEQGKEKNSKSVSLFNFLT